MLSVLRQYDLAPSFPRKVLQEARGIEDEVRRADLAGREDRRRDCVVTIDPDDAKDFDDAISLERVSAGQWKLWVHIADVSHYVRPGTALDEEARRRGNSTYLVDRVVPMLPEELSNGLCSLKPEVDRLTKCAEFLLGSDGRVLKTRFFPAVIHSQRRFTYREAFAVLERRPKGPLEEMLHDANALAQRIRARRFKAGALELDTPELKIRLDERGAVARIERERPTVLSGRFADIERRRLVRLARAWLAHEKERGPFSVVAIEDKRAVTIGELAFNARLDRVDEMPDGRRIVIDYKTGQPPSKARVESGASPQLPLEASIALANGFANVPLNPVTALTYIRVTGGEPAGEHKDLKLADIAAVATTAAQGLAKLIATYDDAETPYRALRRAGFEGAYKFDDFAHLARVAEWTGGERGDADGDGT